MNDNRRWYLTDFQRLLLALMACSAAFLSAMAWGMERFSVLLVAVAIVVVAALGVFLLGLRYNSRPTGPGTAYVISASPPPAGKIVGRCDLWVLLDMPGARTGRVKLRDPSVPTAKWPRTGDVLPTDVDPRTRRVHVRWDRADPSQYRGRKPGPPLSGLDAAPGEPTIEYAPTPPQPSIEPQVMPAPAPRQPAARVFLDDDPALGPAPEMTDPDAHHDPDARRQPDEPSGAPADDDLFPVDFTDDLTGPAAGPAAAASAGGDLPARIPQPRPAEPPPHDWSPAGFDEAMGGMLIVSDVARSVAFYRDKLDFTVVDETPGGAVLEFHGGRLLLQRRADMSPVERRVSNLLFPVPDVDASYTELHGRGVEFFHRPKVLGRVGELELWGTTVRDPDWHGIALTQWRDRSDAAS